MFCHQCGAEVSEGSKFCESCGAQVNQDFEYKYEEKQTEQKTHYTLSENQKNPTLAAIASFLWSGMGQVYNGNLFKGFAFLIGALIGSMIFLIPGIIIWIFGIYDAYNTANQMNRGEIPYVEHSMGQIIIFVLATLALIVIFFIFGLAIAGF
jgi:TM2 domain-containing membrane protein YozV